MHTSLVADIELAFASVVLPTNEPVAVETYDDEGTTEHFQGTHWRDHDFSRIEQLTPCLSFFTPGAYCFFIPAYLLSSLEQPTSWLAEDTARRLCPPKNDPSRPSFTVWWSRLSPPQRRVIISFLKLMQTQYGAIPETDIERLEACDAA